MALHDFKEIGSTGLIVFGGRIEEEWLRQVQGINKWRTYKEMRDNDPIIGAILFAISMLIRQVKWTVQPADLPERKEEAQEMKEFVASCLDDMSMPWSTVVDQTLSMLVFGFSLHEIVYKKRVGPLERDPIRRSKFTDGKIGWRKIPDRAAESIDEWLFDEHQGISGVRQSAAPDYRPVEIPIERLLLFRTTAQRSSPEGRSILRNAFVPWFRKKKIEEAEGIGIERDLVNLPVMYVPNQVLKSSASSDEKALLAELKKIIVNLRRGEQEGVILPGARDAEGNKLIELQLLGSGGSRQFDINGVVERYSKQMAMTVLADFILLGHDKVGSFALSSDKTDLFAVALGAWLQEIKDVMGRFAIPRLLAANGIDLELAPSLEHGDLESQSIKELAEFISKLAAAGAPMFPDDVLENKLRQLAGLPEREPDKEGLPPPQPPKKPGQEEEVEKVRDFWRKRVSQKLLYNRV